MIIIFVTWLWQSVFVVGRLVRDHEYGIDRQRRQTQQGQQVWGIILSMNIY